MVTDLRGYVILSIKSSQPPPSRFIPQLTLRYQHHLQRTIPADTGITATPQLPFPQHRKVVNACRRIWEPQVLPAVSIKKYANPMSLLKADMPIGYKDPTKDVDDGMAGGYSELKEPGEEGEDRHHSEADERLAQDCLVCFAKTVLVFGFERRYFVDPDGNGVILSLSKASKPSCPSS